MQNTEAKLVHVAVGVVKNTCGDILIAKRPDHTHMGGRWEFPGGKVEEGESISCALGRELNEELGIQFSESTIVTPLITIRHEYPEKTVMLDVRTVEQFEGEPEGREGQPLRWVSVSQLSEYAFPDANYPIIQALELPRFIPISPAFVSVDECASFCAHYQKEAFTLWHMRAPTLQDLDLSRLLAAGASKYYSSIAVNASVEAYAAAPWLHLHLNSSRLHQLDSPPKLKEGGRLSASCHNLRDLAQAHHLNVDYVFFSPVKPTVTHPQVEPVGWEGLKAFCAEARVPVYALGGLTPKDLPQVIACGAQGVAGISAFQP